MVYGSVAVLAVMALIMGCPTTPAASGGGRPGAPNEDWNPDSQGNLKFDNSSGLDAAVYIKGRYYKTIPVGTSSFLINVDGAESNGSQFDIGVYDSKKVADVGQPPEQSAQITLFTASLYPAGSRNPKNLKIPEPSFRDEALTAQAGGIDTLVEFSYPFELTQIGSVSAEIIKGPINSGRRLLSVDPGEESVSIPMEPGFNQFTVVYTVMNNGMKQRFYYPNWANDDEAQAAAYILDVQDSTTSRYIIKPISEIGKITWVGSQDNYGKLVVQNKSGRMVDLTARDLNTNANGLFSKSSFITGVAAGTDTLRADDAVKKVFRLDPGNYQFRAINSMTQASVDTVEEIAVEAGTTYYWIIGSSAVTKDKNVNALTDLGRVMQNWKIVANQHGATVSISVISSDPTIANKTEVLGTTDLSGNWLGTFPLSNFVPKLTYENAKKVLLKINVEKEGYVGANQAINALVLLNSGGDFVPEKFELSKAATEDTPGATIQISNVNVYL
jgi:hypothetical protein